MFFYMIITVNLVYQATVVGLNPLQLVLVGTVLEGSVLLFEIPTGIVADVYSRRLSVVIGYLLIGAGFILEGAIPLFETVLLAQVIWGVGATFISGASEAWIADEIDQTKGETEKTVGQVFLRGSQFHQVGGLAGIGLSVGLASINITRPIVLGGLLLVLLAFFLALVMPEQGFAPTPRRDRNSWQMMGQTISYGRQLIRGRPVLIAILGISAIFGMASEGYDRLWTVHILENFSLPTLGQLDPIVWFGIINAVSMFLTLGVAEIARRKIDTDSHQAVARALLGLDALLIAGVILFALSSNFALALAAFWVGGALRATRYPLYSAWTNQHVESKVRATILSINGQADAMGQIAGGPVVGAIGTIFSLRAALVVAGVILSLAPALYAKTLRHSPKTTRVGEET